MPPILPSGKYTISLPTATETYYIGPLKDNPDAIGILPGDVDPRPIVRSLCCTYPGSLYADGCGTL
jgi:hypothetical protein